MVQFPSALVYCEAFVNIEIRLKEDDYLFALSASTSIFSTF